MRSIHLLVVIVLLAYCPRVGAAAESRKDYAAQLALYQADSKLHERITSVAENLRYGRIDAEEAGDLWRSMLPQARANRKAAARLGGDPLSVHLKSLTQLQYVRLDGLIKAADVEAWHGLQLAQLAWVKQKANFEKYKAQQDEVERTMSLLSD